MNVKGLDDLLSKLDRLGNVGQKVGKKAVRSGLNIILKQQKIDAPKYTGNSAKKLRVTKVKQYKGGTVWGATGINSKNWEECKSLFFQHYGYIHNRSGKKIKLHVGWMTDAFEKAKNKAQAEMIKIANAEINKIIK